MVGELLGGGSLAVDVGVTDLLQVSGDTQHMTTNFYIYIHIYIYVFHDVTIRTR